MVMDVLVIGSGGAGLIATLKAAESGSAVLLVDKGLIGKSGATIAGSALASTGPWSRNGDSPDVHFRDTVIGGRFLNNQQLVRILVDEAPKRVRELEEDGLYFDKEPDGKYVLDVGGGHTFPRLLAVSDRVGLQIVKVLWKRALEFGTEYRPYTLVTRILVQNGIVLGATAVDFKTGELLVIEARAIILASGGVGQLYPVTTNPRNSTGDGLALALDAGARLINMEQVQFYPACVTYPQPIRGLGLGILEYGKLLNNQMDRFMSRYEPNKLESTTRDVVARSIFSEITAGRGTEHGGVYLDARSIPEKTFGSYLHEYESCRLWGIDLHHDLVEVAPGVHYFMGGVEINELCETSIEGLYAAGEVAGGLHGANRLNGNSLADIVVFGAIAGEQAAKYAASTSHKSHAVEGDIREISRISDLLNRSHGQLNPSQLSAGLRDIMWRHVNVVRTSTGLESGISALRSFSQQDTHNVLIASNEIRWNNSLRDYLELEAMVSVAECIANSALSRRESRGAHFNADYPKQDDANWLKNTTVVKTESNITFATAPVQSLQLELQITR